MKIIHTITLTLLTTLVFIGCNQAINHSEVTHFSPERLARIDTLFNRYINSDKLSGGTILISQNNKVAYLKSYGYNNISAGTPMENNSIYGITSMTKLVTCVAALILYEKGYFQLNDQLSEYLPEFKNMKVYVDNGNAVKDVAHPILIKNLFSHTSGLKYAETEEYYAAGVDLIKNSSLTDFVQRLSTVPLFFEPGSTFEYSYSIDVLGYLIEKLSGQTLRDFFKTNVFVPLNMHDTDFYVPEVKKDRLANFYVYKDNSLVLTETYENSIYKKLPKVYSGGAGLVTTVEDYAKLLQMMLNYGKYNDTRLLSRKTIELMKTDQLTNVDNKGFLPDGLDFCLGLGLIPSAGQYGDLVSDGTLLWAGTRNTYFWIDYQEDLFGILMTQMEPFDYLQYLEEFRILTYQAMDD